MRGLANRPVLVPISAGSRPTYIRVHRGNTLYSSTAYGTIYGAKVPASLSIPEAVPVAVPAITGTPAYADGLCSGNSAFATGASEPVWLATKVKVGGVTYGDVVQELVEGMIVGCRLSIQVPITGGGGTTARVFLPYMFAPGV